MENTTQPTLTLLDLTVLRNSIAAAAERGAFKAHELSTVGATFDRLNAWVSQAEADLAAQQAAAEEAAADGASEDTAQGE